MKLRERIAIYLSVIGIMYFGAINLKYPWLLFMSYVVFGVAVTVWVLVPMLKIKDIPGRLKETAYFEDFRVPKFLLFTGVLLFSFGGLEIRTRNHNLTIAFDLIKNIDLYYVGNNYYFPFVR